jgi:His-Xaa-Ser repeat protein HxsA
MKIKFKNILSALLIAATAKVAANPTVNGFPNLKLPVKDNDGDKELTKEKQNPLQRYIIKFRSDDTYLIAGHRSHSSHRSHRSHSSHRSSSGGYYAPERSTTPSRTNSSPNSNSSSSSSNSSTARPFDSSEKSQNDTTKTATASVPRICNLGDRTISLGACGTDVKVLAILLVKHGYLAESDIETNDDGYTVCNAAMVAAIKKFQKDAGLEVDGYAGAATIKALKNWKKDE